MKKQLNFKLLFILLTLLGGMNSFAQIAVRGTVTDSHGEVLPGVEITVVGTQKGTVTDFDGHYTIKANKGDKIKASYIGMSPQVKTVTGPQLDFVLKDDALGLDEVVVTAQSGIVTKKQLGSVINTVKMDKIGNRAVSNAAEALQGVLPGARIMRNSGSVAPSISIRLRGPSTVLGSSDPLIMVDGIIINNDPRSALGSGGSSDPLSDIDMNDIDHIEILKGPAASAMYGSMASNGIIQIFTKKGKTGKPTVTFTSSFNINQVRKFKPYNDVLLTWGQDTNGNLITVPIDKRYDYQSYIFTKAYGFYNNVKITGGTDYTHYSLSGSMLSNEGIIRNSNYNRKNIDLKLNQKITDWLKLNYSVIYSNNKTNEIPYAHASSYKYAPLQSILFADNSINPKNDDGTYNSLGWMGNPYESIDKVDSSLKIDRIINNFTINLKPVDNLNIDYIFGYDHTGSNSHFKVPYGFGKNPDGDLQLAQNKYDILSSHIKANYNYKITDDIKASTGAGYQYLYNKKLFNVQHNPELSIFDNLDVMNGSNSIEATSAIYEYAIWGSWIQQHFNFYDKFHLTLGGRWDKASTFGDNVKSFYPKVSGSLILSDFDFWKDTFGTKVNSFKLRGAWGEAGNMTALTSPSNINVKYGSLYTSDSYLGETIYLPNTKNGNEHIKPEVTREMEFGFDASFLDGKIGLEFTKYHQDVKDLLLNTVMAPSSGFSSRVDNVGTLTNDGMEISLKAVPYQNKSFRWDVSFNYSTNKNKVSNISGGFKSLGGYGTSIAANGYPLGVFYGYFYATDEDGNWVLDANGNPQRARGIQIDKDGDGFPESYEQQFDSNGQPTGVKLKKIIGDPNPDYILSFNNNFKYKNFNLFVTIDAIQGFDIFSWDKRMAQSKMTAAGAIFTGWEFAGEELKTGRHGWYGSRFYIYESHIEDGSFVKLRNVSLSYDWNKPFKGIKSLQFNLSGSNLISWDHYWGYDPEVNSWGKSNGARSQDYANIPIPKVYTFGVKVKF